MTIFMQIIYIVLIFRFWFEKHIQILNETANVLGIGKGLEQSIEAAEEVGEKFRSKPRAIVVYIHKCSLALINIP